MKIWRIYAGRDGESHFEEVDLPITKVPLGGGTVGDFDLEEVKESGLIRIFPANQVPGLHTSRSRRYAVILSGLCGSEVTDGTVKTFPPGSVVLVDDLTGKGHITRTLGGVPRDMLFFTLKQQELKPGPLRR